MPEIEFSRENSDYAALTQVITCCAYDVIGCARVRM